MKKEFKENSLILAASLAGFKSVAEKAYDITELAKYLDLVNINTYDYHGFWDRKTGHHSPIKDKTSIGSKSNSRSDDMVTTFHIGKLGYL